MKLIDEIFYVYTKKIISFQFYLHVHQVLTKINMHQVLTKINSINFITFSFLLIAIETILKF